MKRTLCIIFAAALIAGCAKKEASKIDVMPDDERAQLLTQAKELLGALPDTMPGSETDTPDRIALGKKLYHEPKLSINGTQACSSCHNLNTAGVDNKPVSPGAEGKNGSRNSPTTLNAGFQFAQFWDGRAKDLAEQAKGPILNPIEMGMKTDKDVVKTIAGLPDYPELFEKAWPGEKKPLTYQNIANAIAAFERTLVSRGRFDDFLAGDMNALTNDELHGLRNFLSIGCKTCHNGAPVGGGQFQKLGLVKAYARATDPGRFSVTGIETDKFIFKVPQLRNVARTGPWFHDGSIANLEDAVTTMADVNLGQQLSAEQLRTIVAFLKSLDGREKTPA